MQLLLDDQEPGVDARKTRTQLGARQAGLTHWWANCLLKIDQMIVAIEDSVAVAMVVVSIPFAACHRRVSDQA